MPKNSTTANGVSASVLLGSRGDLVNSPMKFGNYMSEFGLSLDVRRFGEIDDGEGDLAMHV